MEKFFLTAAIDYSNGLPHMGHAFEKIGLDAIARYKRSRGYEVFCLVGTDEHSQNVAKKAAEAGQSPKEYCDAMAVNFQKAYDVLQISYDRFIRTTDQDHHEMVSWISQKIYDQGDITKGDYEGFYCVSCEAFYQTKDLVEGLCPVHKKEPSRIKEKNYFFRISKYQNWLKDYINQNHAFIQPETRRNEVLRFLEEPLQDISISRANSQWGIPLPFDPHAVAYVWFDALTNYLTAAGPVGSAQHDKWWPADLHVVGKDITRFHCVIWPIMLKSAGLPIPKTVWGHGFVNLSGEKMSKTTGTAIDPLSMTKTFGAYCLRYFLLKEIPWDRDGDFSIQRMVETHNADLSNGVGNLVSRTISMAHKYFNGALEPRKADGYHETWKAFKTHYKNYCDLFDALKIHEAVSETCHLVRHMNLLIDTEKPWAMAKNASQRNQLEHLLHALLSGCIVLGTLLQPIIPDKSQRILQALNSPLKLNGPEDVAKLFIQRLNPLETEPLFPRMETP